MTTTTIVSSDWFVSLLFDVSLKAILLALWAAAGMWVCRVRATSVQHRVWTAVLVGMLVMPLLVVWTPTVTLPQWAYPDLQFQGGHDLNLVREVESPVAMRPVPDEAPLLKPAAAPGGAATMPATTVAEELGDFAIAEPIFVEPPVQSWTARTIWLLVMCYAFGVVLFGCRLLIGLLAAMRLVRTATPIDLPAHHAAAIGATRVLQSSSIRVPLTVGWLRPAILLPSDWSSWSGSMLEAVLAHEQAHVRRRDPWVALLAQANRVIYWFHPLAWFLARRLTALSESACDDAVIESLGDRTGYARHLLAVAGRLAGQPRRVEPLGVSMAARPMVERRIEAILDDRRPLARRVGWLGTLLLLVAITPAILLAAGITAESEPVDVGQLALEALKVAEPTAKALASETGSLELLVVDEHDVPVPNAQVRMRVRQVFMGTDDFTNHKTDAGGRLKFAVPNPTPHYLSAFVSTPGHAPYLAEWENHETPDPIPAEYHLRLDPGRTIGGIVRDEAGKPIEGVKVRPQFNLALRPERTYPMGSGASVTTNSRGEWIYESLPADLQQVPLTFAHSGFVPSRGTELASRLAIAGGAKPTVVTKLQHGLPIEGRVTDAEGKPLTGAVVTYRKAEGYSSNLPTVKTDGDGHYRITSGEAGEAILTVSSENLAPALRAVRVDREMEAVDFQLMVGRKLQLRVVGPDQEFVEGAYVAFWNWDGEMVAGGIPGSRGKTDARGIWSWGHAPAGELEFSVSAKGFRYVPSERVTPGRRNTIVLAPETLKQSRMLRFAGNVVDAETGKPIAQFRVTPGWKRSAHERIFWNGESQSKGREGKYRREFAPNDLADDADIIVLRVEAEGYCASGCSDDAFG